jgi:hypothetical protein
MRALIIDEISPRSNAYPSDSDRIPDFEAEIVSRPEARVKKDCGVSITYVSSSAAIRPRNGAAASQ